MFVVAIVMIVVHVKASGLLPGTVASFRVRVGLFGRKLSCSG